MSGAPVLERPGREDGPTDHQLVSAVRRGDDRAFEVLYTRYQRRIAAYATGWSRTTAAPRTSPRRSSSPRCGGCARPSARSPSSRGSTRSRRTRASTPTAAGGAPRRSRSTPTTGSPPPTTAGSAATAPGPDAAVDAKQELDLLCGAFGGLTEHPSRDPRDARVRGPELQGHRRAHGHEPPGRREHAVPRAQAAGRGVRRARLRRPLPADPGDHRRGRRGRAWACATSAGSRATSRTASRAAGSPPSPASRSRCPCARAWRASSPAWLPLPGFLRLRRGGE